MRSSPKRPLALVLAVGALAAAATGCGDDGGGDDGAADTTTTAAPVPEGPAADLSTELTGGDGINLASPAPPDAVLEEAGYEQVEYAAEGTATSFVADGELGPDGEWSKDRMITIQFQSIKGSDVEQFRHPGRQVVLYPDSLKSGTLIYPYSAARK